MGQQTLNILQHYFIAPSLSSRPVLVRVSRASCFQHNKSSDSSSSKKKTIFELFLRLFTTDTRLIKTEFVFNGSAVYVCGAYTV